MSMHKGMCGRIGETGPASCDLTLADYINRKSKQDALMNSNYKLNFDQWYINIELNTYDKTEYECMKMAWNASRENL